MNNQRKLWNGEGFHMSTGKAIHTFDQETRSFSGIAYSGEIIRTPFYPDGVIFDLASTEISEKIPMLIEHDRSQRCGVGSMSIDNNISVSGHLLSNEHGQQIAKDADEGFPWQLSVHIQPEQVERVPTGKTITVNGIPCSNGCTIFKTNKIREISFTPTGADAATGANVYSIQPQIMMNEENNINELKIRISDLEIKLSQETERANRAESQLHEIQTSIRKESVKNLFSTCNIEFSDDAAKPYFDMPQNVFETISAQMQKASYASTLPKHLFAEQAVEGLTHKPFSLVERAKARNK